MSLYPEDDDTIKKINDEYEKHQLEKQTPSISPGLNIGHELPQTEAEKEQQAKEAKAKALVDSMQGELKQYIDTQMQAIPQLINQNIQAAFQQIMPQLQQQTQAPPQGEATQQDKIAAIAQLAPVVQNLLGVGQPAAPQNNIFQDMIMQSFVKMIQAKVDETVMGTYGVRVPPPQSVIQPTQPQPQQDSRLNIE